MFGTCIHHHLNFGTVLNQIWFTLLIRRLLKKKPRANIPCLKQRKYHTSPNSQTKVKRLSRDEIQSKCHLHFFDAEAMDSVF